MTKFFYYPQWDYRKVEVWLAQMEEQGYRLEKVNANWWFSFKKTTPKAVQYIFTYNFLKEYAMGNCEHKLKSCYQANQIMSSNMFASVYRIATKSVDLSEIIEFRRHYLRHVFCQKILIALLFFVLLPVALIMDGFSFLHNLGFEGIILLIVCFLSVIAVVWYLIALFSLRQRAGEEKWSGNN